MAWMEYHSKTKHFSLRTSVRTPRGEQRMYTRLKHFRWKTKRVAGAFGALELWGQPSTITKTKIWTNELTFVPSCQLLHFYVVVNFWRANGMQSFRSMKGIEGSANMRQTVQPSKTLGKHKDYDVFFFHFSSCFFMFFFFLPSSFSFVQTP